MKKHIKIYYDEFRIDPEEIVFCEMCSVVAVDVHHINARGMGGDPQGKKDRIENLQACCRSCHIKYGDKIQFKSLLFEVHKKKMIMNSVIFDEEWINNQIEKYA